MLTIDYFYRMKKIHCILLLLVISIAACKNDNKNGDAENDIDAARNFIQAALYGDYKQARQYMLPDTMNNERLDAVERIHRSPEDKKGLAESTINIHGVTKIDTTTTLVIFSNSYKNKKDTLRVKKINDKWLVDFNYLFTHGEDSLLRPQLLTPDTSTHAQ